MRKKPLSEQVVVVTGASSGIGLATARRVRKSGGRVALLDIDLDRCRRAAEELGEGVAALHGDVVDEASLTAAADRVERELGRIGALVCAAGAPQVPGRMDDITLAE